MNKIKLILESIKISTLKIGILSLLILSSTIVSTSLAQTNDQNENEWKTYQSVGKYLYSKPPKADQVFNIQYKVTSGIIEKFEETAPASFIVKIVSDGDGMLEIKIPRNYPYTNLEGDNREKAFLIISDGKEIDSTNKMTKTDCFFVYSIPFSGSPTIELAYTSYPAGMPFYGDEVPQYCVSETIIPKPYNDTTSDLSPLKQFKSGISPEDVSCREGLYLVIKSSNGDPACVKPETKEKLVKRGWANV